MSERERIPAGLMIAEGVTMKDGKIEKYSFGNPLLSNPTKAFGPVVVRADIAERREAELVVLLREAIKSLPVNHETHILARALLDRREAGSG